MLMCQGESDIDQLYCVLRVLGTPTVESWPVRSCGVWCVVCGVLCALLMVQEMAALPDYNKIAFQPMAATPIAGIVPSASPVVRPCVCSNTHWI